MGMSIEELKIVKKESWKRHYQKYREYYIARSRENYHANKEHYKKIYQDLYKKNKEKYLTRQKKYYLDNKEKCQKQQKKYREKNLQIHLLYHNILNEIKRSGNE